MSSQENKENFVNKSNENQIDVHNDLSYENELIKTICYDVYSSHIEKKKIDITQYVLQISKYSIDHSYNDNMQILNVLSQTIPSVISQLINEIKSIKELKFIFKNLSKKNKKNTELGEKIKNVIDDLTLISNGLIDSSSDMSKIFKKPFVILSNEKKVSFSFGKIHKQEFCCVICEDEFIKRSITQIRKKGNEFAWVNEIFDEIQNGTSAKNRELTRLNQTIQSEHNTHSNSINDIDDLLKYINETGNENSDKKKKNKKKDISPQISEKIEPKQFSPEIEAEINGIKTSLKTNSIFANRVSKIKASFSAQWLTKITSKQ